MNRLFCRLLLTMLLATTVPIAGAADLPKLGNPVNQILSPRQEAAIGRRMMAQARQRLDLVKDPEIAGYIDRIGHRLARHSRNKPIGGFTFFVVQTDTINAFAAPGGYIGVHSGLILEAETEAQLASVLAHEIAHVAQRHIARAYARRQRNQFKTIAAVLAGLIIAAQNPEAGQAAIVGGIAAQAQRRINYTRANEYEADRIGIRLMARAGYAPGGMTSFFRILRRETSGSNLPAYLRTHPLTRQRIAEAAARAHALAAPGQRQDTLEFHLMSARLQVLTTDRLVALQARWQEEESEAGAWERAAHRYGLALIALRLGHPAAARETLAELHAEKPENLHYGLALARAQQAAGAHQAALDTWRKMHALYPTSFAAVATGAELLLANGKAERAVELLTEYIRSVSEPPPITWRRLAEAAKAAGRPVRSHEALGEYYVHTGQYGRALTQLEIALERAAEGTPAELRLQARIEQVKAMRRR